MLTRMSADWGPQWRLWAVDGPTPGGGKVQ